MVEHSKEAVSAGYYFSDIWKQKYPKIQILTIDQLLAGAQPQIPPSIQSSFKQAQKVKKDEGKQGELGI
jgi:hypothetical protein